MAEQQLNELRQKLQSQQRQFQNYRDESRNLQAFLQEQSSKKQLQIKKLKEESINKQKLFKNIKIENNQLLTQNSHLKDLIKKMEADMISIKQECQKIDNKELEDKYLKEVQRIGKELNDQRLEKERLVREKGKLQQKIILLEEKNVDNLSSILKINQQQVRFNEELQQNREIIEKLQANITEQSEQIIKKQQIIHKLKQALKKNMQTQATLPSPNKKQKKQSQNSTLKTFQSKKQKEMMQEKIQQLQDKIQRYEKIIKELKKKMEQRQVIQSPQKRKKINEQQLPQIQTISSSSNVKCYTGCIIQTKPHYQSPILQILEENNTIKLFRSTRNGFFQRSLGSSKYKMDAIAYNHKLIVKEITQKIMNYQTQKNHLILIYGVKRSSKKAIMADIITKLFNFLRNKMENQEIIELESIYIKKKSQDEGQSMEEEGKTVDQVLDLLEKASICNQQEDMKNKQKITYKKGEKNRITYFSLRINQFSIQIATSSYTGIPFRQKQTLNTFLNSILYSRTPNILQPKYSQKYLILTLNPIVDLYDQCKNTLSLTLYKLASSSKQQDRQMQGIDKQHLNEMARKKLQLYEKQIQQNLLKLKKIEDECLYFKSKFDQLQNRLKTLLSTHHAQKSHLKKSPILLSYEKLLKFVHAVQSRSTIPGESGFMNLKFNNIQFQTGFDDLDLEEIL